MFRGGGPLTTLLQIQRDSPIFSPRGPSLFQQLWLNVLDKSSFENNFQSINKVMNNIEFGICVDSFDYIPTAIKEIDDNYDQFKNNSYKAFLLILTDIF